MMEYDRDPQTIGEGPEKARRKLVARANAWTAEQAARLDTTREVILAAVCRGWLPEDIMTTTSKHQLEDDPPQLQNVEPWIDQNIDSKTRARRRKALAEALKQTE